MSFIKKHVMGFFLCIMLPAIISSAASAKDVTMIIPFPVGGMVDVGARVLKPYWEKYLGEKMIVINKPGAGGELGYRQTATSRPDGYTIGSWIIPGAQGAQAARKTTFKNDDFDFIGVQMTDPHLLVVRADDDRFPNVEKFVEYVKANPGKVKAGIPGKFADDHLATLRFSQALGLQLAEVYAGKGVSVGTRKQLMGGYIDCLIDNTLLFQGYVGEGKPLKVMTYIWPERVASLDPGAQTLKEATGSELVSATYRGFMAPKGLPADRLKKLRDSFEKAMKDPDYIAEAEKRNIPSEWQSGEDTGKLTLEYQDLCNQFWKK